MRYNFNAFDSYLQFCQSISNDESDDLWNKIKAHIKNLRYENKNAHCFFVFSDDGHNSYNYPLITSADALPSDQIGLAFSGWPSSTVHFENAIRDSWDKTFHKGLYQSGFTSEDADQKTKWAKRNSTALLTAMYKANTEGGIPLHVGFYLPPADADSSLELALLYTTNPEKCIAVPNPRRYGEFVPEPDYKGISPRELETKLLPQGAPTSVSTTLPAIADATQDDLAQQKTTLEDQRAAVEAQIKAVNEGTAEGLCEIKSQIAKLQMELEERQAELMAELDKKKAAMEKEKEKLKKQIFLLDSQIYSILCYAGEAVKFTCIKSGQNAPDTEPIVIYQKLRFLDEDLARLASIYTLSFKDLDTFEDFLTNSPVGIDTFVPNERCISLVRLSRTGTTVGPGQSMASFFGLVGGSNMLDVYKYVHGGQIGILIRNGENIYVGWTDDSRIDIEDNLILTDTVHEETMPGDELTDYEREKIAEKNKKISEKMVKGLISRSFVYSILQGVVDHSDLLPLPKGTKLSQKSELIKYSLASNWLADNKYGSFVDIIDRCNSRISKGDYVLMMQGLCAQGYANMPWINTNRWHNDRGRGEKNRTHDVHASDCTIYQINLVEPDKYDENKICYYISLKKTDTYTRNYEESNARANFQICEDEFVNLTYMNSVWLEWAITTQNLGHWYVGGREALYSDRIKYLKTMLDFVRKRELRERAYIEAVDPAIVEDSEWPVRLSNWKLAAGVRYITEFQAKRFARCWAKDG